MRSGDFPSRGSSGNLVQGQGACSVTHLHWDCPLGFGWADLPILKCTNYLVSLELSSNYQTRPGQKLKGEKWDCPQTRGKSV